MESRPVAVTREELAAFIEGAMSGAYDAEEWSRLMIAHYHDDIMEDARRATVRLVAFECDGSATSLSSRQIEHLAACLRALRAND